MADMDSKELANKAGELLKYINNRKRVIDDAPITDLTPEAHEDAVKAAKPVWTEAMKILGQSKHGILRNSRGGELLHLERVTGESNGGYDLKIGQTNVQFDPETRVRNFRHVTYTFEPGFTLKLTTNTAYKQEPEPKKEFRLESKEETYQRIMSEPGKDLGELTSPQGMAAEKTEANRDELNHLLELLTQEGATFVESTQL